MLGLQGEAVALAVHPPAGADERAVEEVAGVELDAGLGGEHLEGAAAVGVLGAGGEEQLAVVQLAVEHPVVVVAAPDHELLERGVADAVADRRRRAEVHRRALDGSMAPVGMSVGSTGV